MSNQTIGIALGGGGARGFVHLGVLAALAEQGITPDVISGVSAGSIVGVFIAAGMKPKEVMKLMKKNKFTDYAKVNIPTKGLLNLDNLKQNLEQHLTAKKFSDLELPFYVAISNLHSGEVEYKNKGELIPVIQASSSIPVLFAPVEIEGQLYVDGGLLDNMAIAPLKEKCDKLIVVNIMPIKEKEEIDNLIDIAIRTFELSVIGDKIDVKNECDLYIQPEGVEEYNFLESEHVDELFALGYEYVKDKEFSI
ncbi:MAG: patatin-like phospholipase family protein [Bacillota bacterium]